MKKEEIYVIIDNDEKRNKAVEILTDAGEAIWDSESAMQYTQGYNYLTFDADDMDWYTVSDDVIEIGGLTEITLDQLEELLRKEGKQKVSGKKELIEINGVAKTDYSEINLNILDLMAERMTANKHKYPKGNSKKELNIKDLEWALFRHLKKMIQPKDDDVESYREHLSALLCNASMILDQLELRRD